MPQSLSAWNYIKNNKRRVAVLIVSLGLCFVLTYLTKFLLSATEETFRPILMENTRKIQYISLAGSSLGLKTGSDMTEEELQARDEAYEQKNLELAEKLRMQGGVKQVYYAPVLYEMLRPPIGQMTVEIPCVPKEEITFLLKHLGAKLLSGRLPENPGEIVLDEASMRNNDYRLNGYFREENYGQAYQIVGVLECSTYFGCGVPAEEQSFGSRMLVVLSDGSIEDMSEVLHNSGIDVRENYDTVLDYQWGSRFLKDEVTEVIGNSTKYIYIGVMILLSIAVFIVYTMYLRDRHNEWCLYYSIGYSRKTIYFSILRELLFSFGAALLAGSVIIAVSVVLLDTVMIQPFGIRCRYFYPRNLGEILCSYVLILGILQIPIRYALYKIRTVDAMEDEM